MVGLGIGYFLQSKMQGEYYPVESHISSILEHVVVRMPHDSNIAVSRATFRAEVHDCFLGMLTVASKCCRHLSVDNNVDFDAFFCLSLQNLVKTPFLVIVRGAAKKLGHQSESQ